jgi:hypothetical protein
MNYLTNLYKNKAESLAKQIELLENQLKSLVEQTPGYTFTPGGQNAPRQSDADLEARARQIKKSGLFGAQVADDQQSQEYRDIQAELATRKGQSSGRSVSDLMAANKSQRMRDLATEPSQRVSKAIVAQEKEKQFNKSYNDVEATRTRRSAETKPQRQMAATPTLLQRDPNVPTPPAQGQPAPVAGGKKPSYNFQQSSKQISDMASGLLARMGKAPTQPASGTKAPSAPTQTPAPVPTQTGKPTPNKNAVGGGIGTGVDFTTGSESQGGLFGFSYVPTKNGKYLPQQKSSTVSQEYFDRVHPGTKPSSMKEVEARNALANTPQQSAMDALAKYRQEVADMIKRGKK